MWLGFLSKHDDHRRIRSNRRTHLLRQPLNYGFYSGHVRMRELDCEESWAPKNWCFWTGVLEKILESPSDCREIRSVHPKGNQSWIFIGRTDVEAVTPILWPPDAKSWLIWKDPDAGKDWGQGEGDDRGRDGWMASLTQWTWVWVDSGSWFMGLQRVGHDWATGLMLSRPLWGFWA